MNERVKVFEAFAGYGGASYALKKANINYEVVGFSEIEQSAIDIYKYNFPNIKNYGDITKINEKELPDFDLFTGGFPCQPFSNNGKQLGEEDKRGVLFEDIIRICEYKKPKYIFLENVKGLLSKKMKPTLNKIIDKLNNIGYKNVQYILLNSLNYGLPQNRERVYIFGKYGGLPSNFNIKPQPLELKTNINDFLDIKPNGELYRTQQQIDMFKKRGAPYFDVAKPLCYDDFHKKIYENGICQTITPPHNRLFLVEPIKNGKEQLRKLSIDELFRLMGFSITETDREIKYPPSLKYTKLATLVGNGWDINIISILFKHIFKQV